MSATLSSAATPKSWQRAWIVIGMLAAFGAAVYAMSQDNATVPPRVKTAKQSVLLLANAIDVYHMTTEKFPASLDDLIRAPEGGKAAKKWSGPYLKDNESLSDTWNNPILYVVPGKHNPRSYDVWSLGPDGLNGSADDLGNWTSE